MDPFSLGHAKCKKIPVLNHNTMECYNFKHLCADRGLILIAITAGAEIRLQDT